MSAFGLELYSVAFEPFDAAGHRRCGPWCHITSYTCGCCQLGAGYTGCQCSQSTSMNLNSFSILKLVSAMYVFINHNFPSFENCTLMIHVVTLCFLHLGIIASVSKFQTLCMLYVTFRGPIIFQRTFRYLDNAECIRHIYLLFLSAIWVASPADAVRCLRARPPCVAYCSIRPPNMVMPWRVLYAAPRLAKRVKTNGHY
jgi:hypothetical protein